MKDPQYKIGEKVIYLGKIHEDFIGKPVTISKIIPFAANAYHLKEFTGGVSEKLLIEPDLYNSPLWQALR